MMILSTIKLRVLAFARCHSHPYSHFTADSPYNSELIIKNALEAYKKRTKRDLLAHPLTSELETCDSPTDILAVLQRQVQGLDQSWSGDEQWIKRLDPTASVLFAFSARLGVCDSLEFSPVNVIFAGIGVLFSAAKEVRAGHTLVSTFEYIEMFFRRLEAFTEVRPTAKMMNVIIQIMVEVLSILGIAMMKIKQGRKQGRIEKYWNQLFERASMDHVEHALRRLDYLTQEEVRMAITQILQGDAYC